MKDFCRVDLSFGCAGKIISIKVVVTTFNQLHYSVKA